MDASFRLDTSFIFLKVHGLGVEYLSLGHLLLEHVGLLHVLDLAVHLVNFFGLMSQGGHSEPLLQLALFYQSIPSCLKVIGGVGWLDGWPM